jgi:isoquinoline 1-oxidoreductase beta subunit
MKGRTPPSIASRSIRVLLKGGLDAKEARSGSAAWRRRAAALTGAAKKVEAVYGTQFLNHATLEPMNCTAKWDDGKVEIWVGTQNGDASLAAAAEAAGVKLDAVKVTQAPDLGGGFGRRGKQDYVRQAVLIAKQVPGRPVKLIWSREEDMQHGFYRPITQCKLTAGLDAQGNVTGIARAHFRAIDPGLSGAATHGKRRRSRGVPGLDRGRVRLHGDPEPADRPWAVRNTSVPVGFWRGVNTNQNALYHGVLHR